MRGYSAVSDESDLISDALGEGHLVRGQNEVAALGPEFGDDIEDLGGHLRVECRSGFIEEEQIGADGDGTGDGHTLFLAAGEFGGAFEDLIFELKPAEELDGLCLRLRGREAMDLLKRQGEISERVEVGEEVMGLENKAGSPAVAPEAFLVIKREGFAIQLDGPGGGSFEAAQEAEEG
jgi:hypothetical protein